MKTYQNIGEKITIDGVNYYSQGESDDGLEYGYVYKNEQAFYENPDEVCYIPEYAFSGEKECFVEICGKLFVAEDELDCYTRNELENMLRDDDGKPYLDEDLEPIEVERFFLNLHWCYPETRLNELC